MQIDPDNVEALVALGVSDLQTNEGWLMWQVVQFWLIYVLSNTDCRDDIFNEKLLHCIYKFENTIMT